MNNYLVAVKLGQRLRQKRGNRLCNVRKKYDGRGKLNCNQIKTQ